MFCAFLLALGATSSAERGPQDAFSIALFQRENRPASVTNVWTVEINPCARFSYALRRPGRHVEVRFTFVAVDPTPTR